MTTIYKFVTAFSFFATLTATYAYAGVSFVATVDSNQVSLDENVTLSLIVQSDDNVQIDEPRLPELTGFELASKWDQFESSSQFVNGKFEFVRRQVYKYLLTPQKTGKLEIASAEVVVNGQALKSKPIAVTVLAAGAPTRPGNMANRGGGRQQAQPRQQQLDPDPTDPFEDEDDLFMQLLRNRGFRGNGRGGAKSLPPGDKQAFFVQVEVDKTKAFVGEQITASWYLYTTGSLRDFDALKYPDLKGFWKEDLEMATRLNFTQEVVNGVAYNKALLVSYALFPIKEGRKTIDPYKAKATVISNDSGLGMFGIGKPYTYNKSSQEVPIEVLPLPTAGRPESFSGAVGNFDVTAQLSSGSGPVNQPFSLKIKFSGEGNAKAIELPTLQSLPTSLEVYDTKSESKFFKTGQGSKDFEVLLVPRTVGDVTVPSLTVSWFDPKLKQYVTKTTPEFKYKALAGGSGSGGNNSPMAQGENKAAAPEVRKDIEFIQTALPTAPVLNFKTRAALWMVAIGLIYLFMAFNLWRVYRGVATGLSLARKKASQKFKAAKARLKKDDWRGVATESSTAVLNVLGEVSGIGGASMDAQTLISKLPSEKRQALAGKLEKYISHCELISFAPEELVKDSKDPKNLKSLIKEGEDLVTDLLKEERVAAVKRASPVASS